MAKLFCLMGIPGAGKSSVLYRLHNDYPEQLIMVPRITDRPVRKDELPPELNPEYSFKSRQWFKVLGRNGAFAAVENLGDYHYAVREDDLLKVFNDGCPGFLMAGYCGLVLQKKYPDKVKTIFLTVPGVDLGRCKILPQGLDDLAFRMHSRGDSGEKIRGRLELAQKIIEVDKVHLHLQSDYILINALGKLEETKKQFVALLGL